MKWFKHFSDSHSNLKLEAVIDEHGMVGYGLFWLCDELVAQQGENFTIKAEKRWKNSLVKKSQLQSETVEKILSFFADMRLIDNEELQKGNLYIPKLADYGDEYSSRKKAVGIVSGYSRDIVGLDKIRIDKNRREENIEAPLTPSQEAKDFFEDPEPILSEFIEKTGAPADFLRKEFSKFTVYWTEKTASGKKQRWQTQKTFEVKRRLATWLANVKQFSKVETNKGRGLA